MNEPKKGKKTDTDVPIETPDTDVSEEHGQRENEISAYIDRLQRLQAEFENYKKRTAREYAAIEERIEDRTILGFLDLYDNLERAFANHTMDKDTESFVAGVEQIFGQFSQLLEQLGVERISAVGEPFDPEVHEALLSVVSDQERNRVLEEFLPGYQRGERVLRASKVSVSQGSAPTEEADE